MIKLSIIIAAYNVECFIEKCINSCVHQNISSDLYEIVVVNDGSIDKTASVLGTLCNRIQNIKVIYQDNLGLGACRNLGIENSKGDFVWFIDGDDYIENNCLAEILTAIDEQFLDVLALGYSTVYDDNSDIVTHLNVWNNVCGVITGPEFYENNYSLSYTPLFVFKRGLFIDHNIRFRARINMQDSEILPRLLINTNRLASLSDIHYYYVQHANSFTNTNNESKRYYYFKSIVEVKASLLTFKESTAKGNLEIIAGIEQKIALLDEVVFSHLIYFQYKKEWLYKCINLLRFYDFYPLKYKAKGKLRLIKMGMNKFPYETKLILDLIK